MRGEDAVTQVSVHTNVSCDAARRIARASAWNDSDDAGSKPSDDNRSRMVSSGMFSMISLTYLIVDPPSWLGARRGRRTRHGCARWLCPRPRERLEKRKAQARIAPPPFQDALQNE